VAKSTLNSGGVIAALKQSQWSTEAYEWLTEVRSTPSRYESGRFADALVVSCWPSRGLYALGIEVKVARGDWIKELKSPAKSEPIQRFCKYWWLATTPGIVRDGELPETWGLVEVDGAKCKIIKHAPELFPEPPAWEFVASILRNAAKEQGKADGAAYHTGYAKGLEKSEALSARYNDAFRELKELESCKHERDTLRDQADKFYAATGHTMQHFQDHQHAAKAVKLAASMRHVDLDMTANRLENEAARIREAVESLREIAKGMKDG
jgi:hypothetical protein